MRILLLNPPFLKKFSRTSRSPGVSKGGCVYYPIWLAYAAGYLQKLGHDIMLIDAAASGLSQDQTMLKMKLFRPELVAVDTSTPSIYSDIRFADKIKEEISCFVILVGTHVSALPKESLKISKYVDAVARREYDHTLHELAEALKHKKELSTLKGITFRKGAKILSTKDQAFIEDLDQFTFVSKIYKRFLNIKDYFYPANLYPEITIITGRGCPYNCTYCVLPQVMNGHKYRTRSIENVVDEFLYIKKEFPHTKEIFIEDDTFTADKKRVRDFCSLLVKKQIKTTWSANSRADVDLATLKIMKQAGCRLLCVGFESGDQTILNNIRKGLRIETIRQFMKDTKKAGILVHGCFLLGNCGENITTARKTIEFAKELNPDTAQFFPIMVYPGTIAYNWAKQNNCIKAKNYREWLSSDGMHRSIVSTAQLSNTDLVRLCDHARQEFYLRPMYITKKFAQMLTQPKEIKRITKSSATFMRHLIFGTKKAEK